MITASTTYGYSLYYLWLQPLGACVELIALDALHEQLEEDGYSLYHIWLQPLPPMVTASITYGYSPQVPA
jgi:hypothetical protein